MTKASVQHATLVVERKFEASPARVFAAWADPAVKRRRFVEGEGWEVAEHQLDFRVGGREHSCFRPTGGPTFVNETQYNDIVPDQRIIFTYSMARENEPPFSVSLATVELTAAGAGTLLVFTEQGAFLEGADGPRMREQGWGFLMKALERELNR